MRNRVFILISFTLASVLGCSVNPVTGEKELSIMSAQQEVAHGQKNYLPLQQQQGGAYVVDPELTIYVSTVGKKLAAVSDRAGLPYEFVVLNNDVPNAWALPGGKIALNRGLLLELEDEAQLAAVLSHEIVHAAARHSAQQMTQKQLLGVGTLIVGLAAAEHEYGQYIGLGLAGGAALYSARYGRQQELDSDYYGMVYMERAGYEPQAAVELQETFVRLSQGQKSNLFSNLFASHPPSSERVAKNTAKAKKLNSGVRNKAQYQRAIAQIKKDAPAYIKQRQAFDAIKNKDFSSAHSLFNQAIALQADEAHFYVNKGKLYLEQKNAKNAQTQFQKAYATNPDYFLSSLGLGLAYVEQNLHAQAKPFLEQSVKILSTDVALYQLGVIAEKEGNRELAVKYFANIVTSGGEFSTRASVKLQELGYTTAL